MDILTAQTAEYLAAAGHGDSLTGRRRVTLADLPRGVEATVVNVGAAHPGEETDLVRRLVEIGFVPGERVRVIAHGVPGREPVAVRLGGTTFALRRFEAEYIHVVREGAGRI